MAGPSRKSTEVPPPSALRSRADNEAHRAYEQIAHEVGERANALMYERAFEKGRPATEFSVPSSASAQEARRAGVPVFTERPVPSIQIIGTDRSYLGSTHEEAHLAAEAAGEDLRPDLRRPRYMQHVYFDGYDVFDQAKGTRRFVGCSEGEYLLRYNIDTALRATVSGMQDDRHSVRTNESSVRVGARDAKRAATTLTPEDGQALCILSRALIARLESERASYVAAEELFVHEVKRASSAVALVDLARRTIGSPEGPPPEVVWHTMGDHPRYWKQRLVDQSAFRTRSADAPVTIRMTPTTILRRAANLVGQLRPITGFTSGMTDQLRRDVMRDLIIDGRLAATSSAGFRLFVLAMDRRLPRPGLQPQFLTNNPLSGEALSWLLEFPDVPTRWLDDLGGAWADNTWQLERIAKARGRQTQ